MHRYIGSSAAESKDSVHNSYFAVFEVEVDDGLAEAWVGLPMKAVVGRAVGIVEVGAQAEDADGSAYFALEKQP